MHPSQHSQPDCPTFPNKQPLDIGILQFIMSYGQPNPNHPDHHSTTHISVPSGTAYHPSKPTNSNNLDLYGLEPWREHNHEITAYHKKQQQIKMKLKSNRKISYLENLQDKNEGCKNWTHSKCTNSTRTQPHPKSQGCNCQFKGQGNEISFNTISTSNQEKLKWQLEMEVMMKRRKRISNMLKIRHFGYLKHQPPASKQHQLHMNNTHSRSHTRLERWSNLLEIIDDESCKEQQNIQPQIKIKSERSTSNMHEKKQESQVSLQNLYSVLKSYTHRNQVKKRISQKFTSSRARPRSETHRNTFQSSFIKIQTLDQSKTALSPSREMFPENYTLSNKNSIQNHLEMKNRFSECLTNRQRHIGKQVQRPESRSIHTHSESIKLTKKMYAGHSIKNKLILLRSKNKMEKGRKRGSTNSKQHTEDPRDRKKAG